MGYQVWIGTPNEMAEAASKPTLPQAVKWAREQVEALRPSATKFDQAALGSIANCRESMQQVRDIRPGDMRSWQFPYAGIIYRIEIRRTT